MPPQCTALNISDQSRCEDEAGSLNGLFCGYHSKQCQALYKGYKLRNARLDALVRSPPGFLANNTTPLVNQTFADVKSDSVLRELHTHLALRHALLDRVIRARKMHHSRFFAMSLDYGHQHYLDNLSNQKFIVLHALQNLERRTAEVLYQKQNWFKWVRQQQDDEESHRESEKKKIRLEAALFKRHWAQVQLRLKEFRMKEQLKRQDEYLEVAFKEKMSLEEESGWDPIDEVVEDDHRKYIDMIRVFLLLEETAEVENTDENKLSLTEESKTPKKKGAKTGKTEEPLKQTGMETKSQMRKRLKNGVEYHHGAGILLKGTIENPIEVADKTAPLPDDEIDKLLEEIIEIKHLLFCRLLLSQASLLPAAIRANNVDELLADEDINISDLRDLCLKMENPGLQEVRDACADLVRGEEDMDDLYSTNDGERNILAKEIKLRSKIHSWRRPSALPRIWRSKQEQQLQKRRQRQRNIMEKSTGGSEGNFIDFGLMDDEIEQRGKKMRVRICGRSIYNYPSEKAMSRGGWLHFSIIASESSLFDAVGLCRHWDEFFELNVLTVYQFFPIGTWIEWAGDRPKQQLLQLGFVPYHEFRDADRKTVHHQSGSRGNARRSHAMLEARNHIAAYVKRNDQANLRLIQYLSMSTQRILLHVRDAKTGRILISPPKDDLWLVREKYGVGRAAKHDWKILSEVGPKFFETLEASRNWSLGFTDYYDIVIWDRGAGGRFANLRGVVVDMLFKAHRFREMSDTYNVVEPILKILTRDTDSYRVREIKPSEQTGGDDQVESIWDVIHHPETRFMFFNEKREVIESLPEDLFYNDVDALEDQVLFPEETPGSDNDVLAHEDMNSLNKLEHEGFNTNRFFFDLDTDEEDPESDSDDHEHHGSEETSDGEHEDWEQDESDDDFKSKDGEESNEPLSEEVKAFISYFVKHRDNPSAIVDEEDMYDQYTRFLRRESSKVFKESWHKADLEPAAIERYQDTLDLIKKMEMAYSHRGSFYFVGPLAFLDPKPKRIHRRVIPDMRQAFCMMALFFSSTAAMYATEFDCELGSHPVVNQAERAKNLPDRRKSESNDNSPAEFWKELDSIREKGGSHDSFPEKWDRVMRPMIARLYKEGIIGNSYSSDIASQAFVYQEPGRLLDLYFDFRVMTDEITINPELQEPPPRTQLLTTARAFASNNTTARFAFLRLWSPPHFYPLIIGIDKRDGMEFRDGQGRAWVWKFIPKDFPYSEWSIHQQARLRIMPFQKTLKDRVWVRQDTFLVMGTDESDLFKLASAVTYAIQTDPWRLEVDLWRSFVNVDLDFLEGLDERWLY